MNPNNNNSMQSASIPNNVPINKTKGKVNTTTINYPINPSNNGTPVGFYNEASSVNNNGYNLNLATVSNNNTLNMPNKPNNPNNNMKLPNPSNFELCNSYRSETDENIKKAIGIFDNIKLNLCNFIDNYKNKFIHDAETLKQVLLAETEYVIQEEEKNRMIDTRMDALFRDMMNILNEFQRY
jgi:hypothetical protein